MPKTIPVCVVYATLDQQIVVDLNVPDGTTLLEAVMMSGLAEQLGGVDMGLMKKGVYGKLQADSYALNAHDRVEIYRPLLLTPQETRRRRAAGAKSVKP